MAALPYEGVDSYEIDRHGDVNKKAPRPSSRVGPGFTGRLDHLVGGRADREQTELVPAEPGRERAG
ncbi:hypothetical protein ACWDR3_39605, partial [Streptomyces sp. NPDC001002]